MHEIGFWIFAGLVIVGFVAIGALVILARNDDELSGELPGSIHKNKADHPVPHDASEEDASDPGAAALMWSPDATSAGLELYS